VDIIRDSSLSRSSGSSTCKGETLLNVLGHFPFDLLLPRGVRARRGCDERAAISRGGIELPNRVIRVIAAIEDGPPDILAKDAAVLICFEEVLSKARSQLIGARMRSDAHNPSTAVRHLSSLKEQVDAIERDLQLVEWEIEGRARIRPTVKVGADIRHGG